MNILREDHLLELARIRQAELIEEARAMRLLRGRPARPYWWNRLMQRIRRNRLEQPDREGFAKPLGRVSTI